ncbi:MAG: ComF family protein [Bacteroidota bacterium]
MGALYPLIQPFIDFIFPPTCLVCQKVLEEDDRHLCHRCWNSIPLITRSHHLYCDTSSKLLVTGQITELASVFVFEKQGVFQALAHALKYDGFQSAGRMIGGTLGEHIIGWNINADVLIPVPLHKAKFRERGFNQAECIARGIKDRTGWPVESNALVRKRYTQTQTKLDSAERQKNMEDAFVVPDKKRIAVKGRTCVLVDDVITTGATILSCADALLSVGARSVIAASAALAE